jgi:hypothetical protein
VKGLDPGEAENVLILIDALRSYLDLPEAEVVRRVEGEGRIVNVAGHEIGWHDNPTFDTLPTDLAAALAVLADRAQQIRTQTPPTNP